MSIDYHCHPETVWAVQAAGVLIFRGDTGAGRFLGYPEAALWDLLSRRTPVGRLLPLLAVISGRPYRELSLWVNETLDNWTRQGWLTRIEADG